MSNLVVFIYQFFQKKKGAFYFLILVSLIFIVFFSSKIRFKEDISDFISDSDTSRSHIEILKRFRFSDKLIVLFSVTDTRSPGDPSLLCSMAGRFIDSLNQKFDSGYIRSVSGQIQDSTIQWYMDFFYRNIPFYLDPEDYRHIDSLINPQSVRQALERNYRLLASPAGLVMKKNIPGDPFGFTFLALEKLKFLQPDDRYRIENGFILSQDKKNLILFITPANPSGETDKNQKLLSGIDQIFSSLTRDTDGKIKGEYFGSIAMSCGNADRIKKDIIVTVSIAMFLILLLIGVYFRSFFFPLLSFSPALFGAGFALALIYLLKKDISSISLGIGSVILGLIVDYALYIMNHFRKKGDVETTLKDLTLTIILCAITSVGAFLCMTFLHSQVLFDLGLFAAFSIAGAALFSIIFLPHFLPRRNLYPVSKEGKHFIDKIAGLSTEKNPLLLSLLLILGIISLFTHSKSGFEQDMMAMNYYPENLRTAENHINEVTGGSRKNIFLVATGKNLEEALKYHEQQYLTVEKLSSDKIIRQYSGIGNLLPSDSMQSLQLQRWNSFWTPEKKDLLKQLILSEGRELKFRDSAFQPFFLLLNKEFSTLNKEDTKRIRNDYLSDWINDSGDPVMISSILQVKEGSELVAYNSFPASENLLLFDRQILTNQFVEKVKQDFELLISLSMIFVSLLLLFSLGRIELAILAALPMFFSWLLTLGFMGLSGTTFNIFNIIVSTFIFGLGVDYSILMLRGLLHECKYGTSEIRSYKASILLSSLTTLIGVGVLFFAEHPALHSIALVSVVGILFVILITFSIQPLLFNELIASRLNRKRFPVTARIVIKTFITWGNIVIVALLLMLCGFALRLFLFIPGKRKEKIFHKSFQVLSRIYIQLTFPPKNRVVINPQHETFCKPAIIISNHQSLIETPAFLRFHPKILILTTTWVYNSVIFGPVARLASFFNADLGIDTILDDLKRKVSEGYSILIFPEAHRSEDGSIQRFHKGAFYLAEKLGIDILPVVVFGTGDFLGKGAFWGRPNSLFMKLLPRIPLDDATFGKDYRERTRQIRQYYIREYHILKNEVATGKYYRRKLTLNYIYKGPVLEWYFRVKLKLSRNYQKIIEVVPSKGKILDLGCGYGFVSTMLSLTGNGRQITGVDHDPEKIAVASNCYLTKSGLEFCCSDINSYEFGAHDCFLISDVLHYLKPEEQTGLILRCINNLNPDGVIVIREADCEKNRLHRNTRLTEFFSTKILSFNKTGNDDGMLHFTSLTSLTSLANMEGLSVEVIEEAPGTSNLLMVMRKNEKK